jgi:hypothetical protein
MLRVFPRRELHREEFQNLILNGAQGSGAFGMPLPTVADGKACRQILGLLLRVI